MDKPNYKKSEKFAISLFLTIVFWLLVLLFYAIFKNFDLKTVLVAFISVFVFSVVFKVIGKL